MNPHRRLLTTGRTAIAALGAAIAVGLATAMLAVAQAVLLAHTISAAFLDGAGVPVLGPALAALAMVLLARACLGWAAEVVAQRVSGGVKADLRGRVLAAAVVQGARPAVGRSTAGVALLATRGLDALDGYYGRYLPQVALAVVVPVTVVACLLLVDGIAALTVALTVPLIPLFMVLIGRMSVARRDRRWAALGRLANRFADVVGGLPTLRAYGRAEAQVAILRRITDAYRSTTLDTLRVAFLSSMTLELLATLSVALVAVGVGLRLVDGTLSLETGLFALVLAPEAYLPLRRLGAEFHASEEGVAAARDAFALLDAAASGVSAADGEAVPVPIDGIRVDGLSVEQPGRLALAPSEASLEVRAGELVAVTGTSGAGKTTLLATVLGFVEPTAGRVSVLGADGTIVDVRSIDREAWRRSVAWVPQAPYLFPGTVADNVRLGAPDVGDTEVAAALAAVGLGDVGADRIVGERGAGLSGGQRRRVGVARALVRRSPVLLLDEPTAGLDADAERVVMAAIRAEAGRGAAVVLVAHRPGAVAGADRTVEISWTTIEARDGVAGGDGTGSHAMGPAAPGSTTRGALVP